MFFETTIDVEEAYQSLKPPDEIATCERKHEKIAEEKIAKTIPCKSINGKDVFSQILNKLNVKENQ